MLNKQRDTSKIINQYSLVNSLAPSGLRVLRAASPPAGAGGYSPWNPSDSDMCSPKHSEGVICE
jgi:hypothetical protein